MDRFGAAFRLRTFWWLKQLCVASVLVFALASRSTAQPSDVPVQSGASAQQLRLSFELDEALVEEARSAFVWRVTWTAIYGALAVGAIAALPLASDAELPAYWVGAISSGVSALFTWFLPLEVEASARDLAGLRDPHGSASRRVRVRNLYGMASADEHSRVAWPWHAVNVVLALIPAIILWAGYEQLSSGLIQLGAGVVLGEVALLTQPTGLATSTPTALGRRGGLTLVF